MYPFNVQFGQEDQEEPYSFRTQEKLFPAPEMPDPFVQPKRTSLLDAYRQTLANRKTPKQDAYEQFISQGQPNFQSPDKMTRIAAILAGAASGFRNPGVGAAVANDILLEPYKKQVSDYQIKRSGLKDLAEMETSRGNRDLQELKTFSDIENQQNDNERQAEALKLTAKNINSQLEARAITMAQAKQQMRQSGFQRVSNTDGTESYTNPFSGESFNLGKTHESVKEKRESDFSDFKMRDVVTGNRQDKNREDQQAHDIAMQEDRQKAQQENLRLGNELAIARAAAKLGKGDELTTNQLRKNRVEVEAKIKADPNKYDQFWKLGPEGYKELSKPPDYKKGPEELKAYQDWVDLYNLYFAGVDSKLSKYPEIK